MYSLLLDFTDNFIINQNKFQQENLQLTTMVTIFTMLHSIDYLNDV